MCNNPGILNHTATRPLVDALSRLAEKLPTRGFEVYFKRVRRKGHKWNGKCVLRVSKAMDLKLRGKHKKRLPARVRNPLGSLGEFNEVWSMDLIAVVLSDGRKVRVFNVMDDRSHWPLAMEVALNFRSKRPWRPWDIRKGK